MTSTTDTPLVAALTARLHGRVLLPHHADFDAMRWGWNRTVEASPDAIIVAQDCTDVQATIRVAREFHCPLHVQSTGHGTLRSSHSGLLLNLSSMNDVHIDTDRRLATVGPGATWHDVNRASAAVGLGSLAGRCGTVGVVGYTLGGGSGWLSRTFGYAADSVVSAEIVTATGELLTIDRHTEPDLFWAIRGGGGNFGVITSLTFRLFPAPKVFSGMSFYPVERATDIFGAYRDWSADEPDGMNTAVLLMRLPPSPAVPESLRGRQVIAIRAFALCDETTGRRHLEPLLQVAGPALVDNFAERGFADASAATNGPDAPPMPHRQLVHLFDTVDDELLDATLGDEAGAPDSPFAFIELRHWGGAMAHPSGDVGCAGHRNTPYSILAVAPYLTPDRAPVDRRVDALEQALARRATGGSFLTLQTDPDRTATAFTVNNFHRLKQIKSRWDPDDFCQPSHHIAPYPTATTERNHP
ncbi:FAD-binding oxidoreductase [Gordonia sp. CPCC 205515]|uniref:FAD-binding oxidoreductase n=1 Tax=Gordonia sp. CPCC 205515 TaxID=3140791 RepID=UPI003AF34B5F